MKDYEAIKKTKNGNVSLVDFYNNFLQDTLCISNLQYESKDKVKDPKSLAIKINSYAEDYNSCFEFHLSTGKLAPKRVSTTSIGDILANLNERATNIVISPCLYGYFDKGYYKKVCYSLTLDIDNVTEFYDNGITQEDYRDIFINKYPYLKDFLPNYIITTGNGLHLIWNFEQNIFEEKINAIRLQRMLCLLCDGDKAHLGLDSAFRLPKTINQKYDTQINYANIHSNKYMIREFVENLSTELKQYEAILDLDNVIYNIKPKNEIKSIYFDFDEENNNYIIPTRAEQEKYDYKFVNDANYLYSEVYGTIMPFSIINKNEAKRNRLTNRSKNGYKDIKSDYNPAYKRKIKEDSNACLILKDIDKWLDYINYYVKEGNRNNLLFFIARVIRKYSYTATDVYNYIWDYNKQFKYPLDKQEVKNIANSAFSKNYYYSPKEIAKILDYPDWFMENSKIAYNNIQSEELYYIRQNKYKFERRNITRKKKMEKIKKLTLVIKRGGSISDAKKVTGWCEKTIRKYSALIKAQIEKNIKFIKSFEKKFTRWTCILTSELSKFINNQMGNPLLSP